MAPTARPSRILITRMTWRVPAGARHGAARLLQGQQEFVTQKGLSGARQRVPTPRINLRDAVEESRFASRSRGGGARFDVGLGLHPFQIFIGVECRHASGARGGNGLTVDMVGHIARREHARRRWWPWLLPRCRP